MKARNDVLNFIDGNNGANTDRLFGFLQPRTATVHAFNRKKSPSDNSPSATLACKDSPSNITTTVDLLSAQLQTG